MKKAKSKKAKKFNASPIIFSIVIIGALATIYYNQEILNSLAFTKTKSVTKTPAFISKQDTTVASSQENTAGSTKIAGATLKNYKTTENTSSTKPIQQIISEPTTTGQTVPINPPIQQAIPIATQTCLNYTANKQDSRGMWVWADIVNNKQLVTKNTKTNKDFFDFVDSHKIQTAYVYLPTGFLNNTANTDLIKTFLNDSKNHCLNIEALDGDIDWIFISKNNYALDFANAVKNFNAKLLQTDTKIMGLQYDVEPKGITITVGNQFLDMLQMAKNTLSGTGILLDIAPTRWYDTASPLTSTEFIRTGGEKGKSLMQHIFNIVDVMTVQDYTQNAQSIYSGVQGELDYAAQIGKKVRVGVDTAKGDEAKTSFGDVAGITCKKFNDTLTSSYNMMTDTEKSAFDGFSVEFYKGGNNTPFAYSEICP